MTTTTFEVQGLNCASCVGRVQRVLDEQPDVIEARVNLLLHEANITGPSEQARKIRIAQAITDAGYPAKIKTQALSPQEQQIQNAQEIGGLKQQFLLAFFLTIPVFALEMGGHIFPPFHHWLQHNLGQSISWGFQAILISLVMIFPGRAFYQLGLKSLFRGHPDMNSLVALGTLATWGYSMFALLFAHLLPLENRVVYFESAGVIITLILLGRYFEARAKGRTGDAIAQLVQLQSKTARVRRADQWVEILQTELRLGDHVQIHPGETVPADGRIIEGHSFIDESMLTGEPLPVDKSPQDPVIGGSINGNGSLVFKVTQIGAQSTLNQIIRLVHQAQASQLPIQSLVNRITLWFVPAVICLAFFTFCIWKFWVGASLPLSLIFCVSVLIVACPCAMGLATPTSIMIATGRAAQSGIIFSKGSALQSLNDVQNIVFDKTGTLSEGKPTVCDFHCTTPSEAKQVLAMIGAIEQFSEHPIAQALIEHAQQEGVVFPHAHNVQILPGRGASGQVQGREVQIGNAAFMKEIGCAVDAFENEIAHLSQQGKTLVFAAKEAQIIALMGVSDPLRAEAKEVINDLNAQGYHLHLLSGDTHAAAGFAAAQLGITNVQAQATPQEKHAFLSTLSGGVVFVGDGINDAPALASADVGIAIGTGTDVAIEAADVVLISPDLRAVSRAIKMSQACLRNIKQNLFWAFGYNILLIPIAAGMLYPHFELQLSPEFAAGAMALSSIFVLLNALRLRIEKVD